MTEQFRELLPELITALGQTLGMLGIGLAAALLVGGPLGILLYEAGRAPVGRFRLLAKLLGWTVNAVRSFPFIVLLVALVPFTRILTGTSIGPLAAAVPLSIAAIPYFARLVEQTLAEVPQGVIEAAQAMGLTARQTLLRVELPLALPAIMAGIRIATVTTISLATVAAYIGAGGLGEPIFEAIQSGFKTEFIAAGGLAIALAIVADILLVVLQRAITPWSRRRVRA